MHQFSTLTRNIILAGLSLVLFTILVTPAAAAPVVSVVTPNIGVQGAVGLQIDIMGAGFELGGGGEPPVVVFGTGSDGITVIGPVLFIDEFNLTCFIDIEITTPLQSYTVFVVNQSDMQQGFLVDGFTVLEAPTIESINPSQGYTGDSGLAITIYGTLLATTYDIDFGPGTTLDSIDSVSPDIVECKISIDWLAFPGFRDVTIYTESTSVTFPNGFEVLAYNPPMVSGVLPDFGCQSETNIWLTVSGSGFIPGISFDFSPPGITINQVIYGSNSLVTLNIDIGPLALIGLYDLTCTNIDNQFTTHTDAFEVLDCSPVMESVFPTQGNPGDTGLAVSISGSYLFGATDVSFGADITVQNFTPINEYQIDVIIDIDPLAILGFRDVWVTTNYGLGILPNGFEITDIVNPPQITSVNPDIGYQDDIALPVTIFGQNLENVTAVDFGPDISVTFLGAFTGQVDVNLDIDIGAVPGFRNVTVSGSTGDDSLTNGFEVISTTPLIEFVVPNQGQQGSIDLPVTLTGQNFIDVNSVDFGAGITEAIIGITDTAIDVLLNIELLATLGPRNVTVTNIKFQSDVLLDGFTVTEAPVSQPQILGLNPSFGYQSDTGLGVTITGSDFMDGVNVNFNTGDITVQTVFLIDTTTISVTIDITPVAVPGLYNVTVDNPDGGADVLVNGFEIRELPMIESIDPTQAYQGDTIPFSVYGTGFQVGATFYVEPVASYFGITYQVDSATLITGTFVIDPICPIGLVDIFVQNPDGKTVELPGGFEVLETTVPTPYIESIIPSSAYQGDTFGFQLNGGNFQAGATFYVAPVASFFDITYQVDSSILISGTITIDPLCPTGLIDLFVENPDGHTASMLNSFEVLETTVPLPYIDSIIPSSAYQGDTIGFQLNGGNFQAGATFYVEPVGIYFDITYQVDSPTLISGTITIDPLCPIGLVDLFVENPDGHTASMLNSFEVLETTVPLPHIDSIIPTNAYPGDTFGFQLNGGNFQTGATFYVEPVGSFFDITYQVDSPTQISGTIEIDPLCPIGYVDLFVENPDGYTASLYNGFEVLDFSPESPFVDWMDPTGAFQGDTINFQISGGNFQTGATLEFPGLDSFLSLSYQVDSGTLISGTMTIDQIANPGSYDARITNPDMLYGSLFNAFTVYELVPELAIESINPYQLCRRQFTEVTVLGEAFEPGSEFTVEYQGFPTDYVTVQSVNYANSTLVYVLIEVTDDAPLDFFDLRVENSDSSFAYGPQIEVIECGEGLLLWQEGLLDVLIQYDGPAGVVVESTTSATLQNAGEVGFNDIVVGMTELVSADGGEITSEYVEIFPSPVGEMGTGQHEIIQVRFSIPMNEELVLFGGGVFMGSLVARDNETGMTASLPVSVTIITTGTQVIEIDPLCLQVDLLGPGITADQVPGIFDISEEFPSSLVEYLGGCTDPFPLFQWTAYGSGCDGYMETWLPSYTISVYPIYPSQSPESAVSNNPVWRADGINEEFIQYSPAAEPLSGLYLWQVEVVPEPMPGLAITVDNITPVMSEIWAFCVETDEFQEIPEFIIEGDIMWHPESLVLNGVGMVEGNLVLSHEIISNLGTDPISISWQDAQTGDTLVTWLGNVAVLQLSYESPAPDFGPVTIPFGINLAPIGNVGPEMGPEDFVLQFWNGGSLICGTDLGLSPSGQLTGMADIGGSVSTFDLTIIWPWEDPCWKIWLDWWLAKTDLDEDCEDEWDALEEAEDWVQESQDALNEANDALDEALDAYLDKLIESMQADLALESAQTACEDFFSKHIFSNVINFSDPGGEGWSYFEAFGGQVGIWFLGDEGAELLNFFMDEYGSEYNALWDQLREAQDSRDDADENLEDAENAFDDASDARDAAQQALEDANDEYNALLADLNNCLAYMNYLAEYIAWLEWFYPECFRWLPGGTSSGVGTPGLEGGAQGPPVDEGTQPGGVTEDGGTGTQPGTDTGIGTGAGDCPCVDCDDEYADLLIAELFLEFAEQDLDDLLNQFGDALDELDQAQAELDEAQEAYDAAEEAAEETQDKLDNFVDNHVFSDVVGSTPDHGPGHVKYKGVDFYFSDFDIFYTIFKILQEAIDEAAAANEAAQEALIEADANLLAADVKLLDAIANVAQLQNDITGAQNAVVQAEQEYLDALQAYLDCIDFARLCHEIFGCAPFVAPHETDPAGLPGGVDESGEGDQPGDEEGDTEQPGDAEGETEQPGDTEGPSPGNGTPGVPPGQGTGDGTEEGDQPCPCGDCEDEYNALIQAHIALENAEEAVEDALAAFEAAVDGLEEQNFELRYAEEDMIIAQEFFNDATALLVNAQTDFEKEFYKRLVEVAANELVMATALFSIQQQAFDDAQHQAEVASDNYDTAWNQYEQAIEKVKAAENAYFDCLEALENCRREHGCDEEDSEGRPEDPSIPIPGETDWPGPWGGDDDQPGGTTPGDGGTPGDGTTPGEPFGGDVPDDTGSGELGECPCDDCAWELEMLKMAEEFMEMAKADWNNALDALISAYEETAAAEADLESLEAQEEGAQEAVDELQEKLDEFMEKHVFVNGVGGDPSAGPNHVVYKGVDMYFSDANMLMNVFDLIKEGIDKLAGKLAEAKADLEAIQESLESAREHLEAAEAAEAEAEANEQEAWDAYQDANDWYLDALVDYMLCLLARASCLAAYPEECADEPLEPGGSSGSGGTDGKSASGNQNHKQPEDEDDEEEDEPVQPYSLDELIQDFDTLLWQTTQDLAGQVLMADQLMADVIGTRQRLDDVFAELRDAIVEAGEKAMATEALVSSMPDSSWILTVYAEPDDSYEVIEHESLFIYYPSGSEAEIETWLIEYEDELGEFAKPAEFMPVDLANAIDDVSNSLEAYNHGIGLVAGYTSMVESLTEYSGMLNELVDTASKTLSENNSSIQEVMDELDAIRAEAEELGH